MTGTQVEAEGECADLTRVFADALVKEARKDDKIVAITAAMPSGTGLEFSQKAFPDRTFDVGIAEQHAVTFAAGLATEGYKPFCAIYSTFLQRAYDQVVHDVAIQKLPVRFAIDRAGLVGADGATHAGSFDVAYLGCLPGMVVMAAADEAELVHMVATAVAYRRRADRASAIRAAKASASNCPSAARRSRSARAASSGRAARWRSCRSAPASAEALKAAEDLAAYGLSTTVADARFAKPLDVDLISRLARNHEVLITVEEGSVGGFGSFVTQALLEKGLLDGRRPLKLRSMVLPDVFLDHDKPEKLYTEAHLDAKGIVAKVLETLGREDEAARALIA